MWLFRCGTCSHSDILEEYGGGLRVVCWQAMQCCGWPGEPSIQLRRVQACTALVVVHGQRAGGGLTSLHMLTWLIRMRGHIAAWSQDREHDLPVTSHFFWSIIL